MIRLTLAEVAEAMGVRGDWDAPPRSVRGVSTDSRTVQREELFFALRGPNFDGHDYAHDALRRGAAAAVIGMQRRVDLARDGEFDGRLIPVDDPLAALARLARYHRGQLAATLVAVVGSNGKTTTKAMIDHVLSARLHGRSSPKSFNNAVGVPLTLLGSEAADDYLVVEIGSNAAGEIAALAEIVAPDMAVITSIGEEHLLGLRDLDGVADEECAILDSLSESGFAAVNADCAAIASRLTGRKLRIGSFGKSEAADLRIGSLTHAGEGLRFTLNERFAYELRTPAAHDAWNAAAAITIARRLGFEHEELAERLSSFHAPRMRSEVIRCGRLTLINDAYNSNPPSALAAIDTLERYPADGRRIFVMGEMRELGERSAELHERVALRLRAAAVEHVVLVGPPAEMMWKTLSERGRRPRAVRCPDVSACISVLRELAQPGDVVLLKASRAVGLERVVDPLRGHWSAEPVA